jgi:4,5-DOPA dioxygenase extradiol
MPAVFLGHGNPANACRRNLFTQQWAELGVKLPRPRAILSISAHWYVEDSAVTISAAPQTLHDFEGFPKELYQVQYPAPGYPELAASVQSLLSPIPVRFDERRGLDHGTWSVLCHLYPQADVPVVQLSIDATKPPQFHFEVGQRLAALRDEGILIMGSGNIVHNLQAFAWRDPAAAPYKWAVAFEQQVKDRLLAAQNDALIHYRSRLGQEALLAVPSPDHYLPLLYVLGTRSASESVRFPVTGIDGGSISMLAVQLG